MEYNAAIPGGFARQRGSLVIDPSGLQAASDTWHLQHHGRPRLGGETGGFEEAMWQLSPQQPHEGMEEESGPYPERPGEPDCVYYMRTGLCGFGMSCRYNHPPNRKLVMAAARNKGEYPERIGQPECQYYVKTGTCKFGATCKYHHPRDKAGTAGRVSLNVLGYPLRPNEKECTYYLRTGQCKYGATCKFHHPQPVGTLVPLPGSPLYTPPVHSPSTPGPQPYPGGLPSWPVARAPFIQSPRWQGPSSYAPLILPQGIVSVPSWSTYPGQVGSISSPDGQQQAMRSGLFYRPTHQTDPMGSGVQGSFSPYLPGSSGMRLPTLQLSLGSTQREGMFPERPGQPECQFYMKTGDCKFGMTCKFHHPKDRKVPSPNCLLNPSGLPLRPGAPSCTFYSRYGICKFGSTCKFDHPVEALSYSLPASSPVEIPVVRHALGSSSTVLTSSMSSELPVERGAGRSKDHASTSEIHQQSSGVEGLEADVQRTTSSSILDSTFSQG